jgi:UDP-N-acetyl-D-mannosaminuronic acid dehydrogenase
VTLFSSVSVVGLGYIGLPAAAAMAARGIRVTGVDIRESIVETINRGEIHIVEPGLERLVKEVVSMGLLRATTEPERADAFVIAVPTPFSTNDASARQPDMSFVEAAARSIAPVLESGNLVVLESTSPVGATEQMERILADLRPDLTFPTTHGETSDIRIAHCPERILPGHALRELAENDRIVGGVTPACSVRAVELYKLFVEGDCLVTDCRTAEMTKLAENSFRDVNIAFANELSLICDELGIDVWELISLANHHPRVNILRPGAGVGGHCIAVDPWFIVSSAPKTARLIRTARQVNDHKPLWVLSKIFEAIEEARIRKAVMAQEELTVACYGLAFKPDVDDLRESPALEIAGALSSSFPGRLLFIEPHVRELPASLKGGSLTGLDEAIGVADVHIVLVGHTEFTESARLRSVFDADFTGIFAGGAGTSRARTAVKPDPGDDKAGADVSHPVGAKERLALLS